MTKTKAQRKWIDLKMDDIDELLERAKDAVSEDDYEKLEAIVNSLSYLTELVEDKKTTIKKLRELLFGQKSEKTDKVLDKEKRKYRNSGKASDGKEREKAKGHGRHGADAYTGAERVQVPNTSLSPGAECPQCDRGKVYRQGEPGVLVRLQGRAPLAAKVYELERYRCNLCGEVFTAKAPDGVGEEKYDASAAAMIGLLKYGSGLPFNRLEGLQGSLGIPLPSSTQWEIVEDASEKIKPVYKELIREAAQGEVVYNDDTSMKVLTLIKENEEAREPIEEDRVMDDNQSIKKSSERTGIFTSGIVSTREGRKIALFFTGRQHAGENLSDVLSKRALELDAPLQMCDALSRNLPKKLDVIVGNCLAHGRRNFVDVIGSFPDECQHVLETLAQVYKNDAETKDLSPSKRLQFHKTHSKSVMDDLKKWFDERFKNKDVEPNSGLGEAITYMTKRWDRFTLFLRKPGAPLDNNICERALKKAILHRKNSLFYKTEAGAKVGDIFMSLIYTCQLSDLNPFDYLTAILKNAPSIASDPDKWMPWNYGDSLGAETGVG